MKVDPIFNSALALMKGKPVRFDFDREQNDPDWEQQAEAQRHREMDLDEALNECHYKGVSPAALQTLLFETGSRWMPDAQRKPE